jgi:hypothetical protein
MKKVITILKWVLFIYGIVSLLTVILGFFISGNKDMVSMIIETILVWAGFFILFYISERDGSTGKEISAGFENKGTSKREKEVARLLNKKIPGNIVEAVRFAWIGSSLYVSVDLYGGRSIKGGYVNNDMSAEAQADSIYDQIIAIMNI